MARRRPTGTVREMRPEDFPAVRRLWERVGFWPHFGEHRGTYLELVRRNAGFALVYDVHDEIVGAVNGTWDGHRAWIARLGVLPEFRRRGVGVTLLKEAERRLFEAGCIQINLMVYTENDYAHRFYVQRGYTPGPVTLMRKRNPEAHVKAVIFDLGNVIIPFDHLRSARSAARRSDLSAEEIYNRVFGSDLVDRYDIGAVSTRQFLKAVRDAIRYRGTLTDLRRCWNAIFRRNPAMERLVASLADRYRLVLLSNTNRSHFEHCWEKYPITRTFRRRVISYEVGLLKPDPAIYDLAVEKAGVAPGHCLYIDDKPAYTNAANDHGVPTITFTGVADLRKALRAMGVKDR